MVTGGSELRLWVITGGHRPRDDGSILSFAVINVIQFVGTYRKPSIQYLLSNLGFEYQSITAHIFYRDSKQIM